MDEQGDSVKEDPPDRFLSVQRVAEILSCTDRYVYDLIQAGSITAIKLGDRALRISEKSLKAFISTRTVNPDDYFAPPEKEKEKETPSQKSPVARSNWMSRS